MGVVHLVVRQLATTMRAQLDPLANFADVGISARAMSASFHELQQAAPADICVNMQRVARKLVPGALLDTPLVMAVEVKGALTIRYLVRESVLLLGRHAKCDIVLVPADRISTDLVHALVLVDATQIRIIDLASSNGTIATAGKHMHMRRILPSSASRVITFERSETVTLRMGAALVQFN